MLKYNCTKKYLFPFVFQLKYKKKYFKYSKWNIHKYTVDKIQTIVITNGI